MQWTGGHIPIFVLDQLMLKVLEKLVTCISNNKISIIQQAQQLFSQVNEKVVNINSKH